MPAIRPALPAAAILVWLLQACTAAAPVEQPVVLPESQQQTAPDQPSAPEQQPEPELTLNLPQQDKCDCTDIAELRDYTFLEKGFDAMVAGEYIDAVQYFQRYNRLEDTPESDWETGIAIAYISMLAKSPFYDPEVARKSYRRLKKKYGDGMELHAMTLVMRDSLETFVAMEHRIEELEAENTRLTGELQKREEAIRRLRELTLGQKGAEQ